MRVRNRFGSTVIFALWLVASLAAGASSASAATSVQSGWWTLLPTSGAGGLPAVPAANAPDAPAGSLVALGGPDGNKPIAYAAVSFLLSPAEHPVSLTLKVAKQSVTTPNAAIEVCPLTSGFAPASGGPSSNAPSYDCQVNVSEGPSADGSAYTFDVSGFGRGSSLAVAILPTEPASRVVLDGPTADALTTAPSTTTTTIQGSPSATPASSAASSAGSAGAIDVVPRPATPTPARSTASSPSATPSTTPPASLPNAANAAAASSGGATSSGSDASAAAFALLLILLAATAGLWAIAGSNTAAAVELGEE